MFAVVIVCPNLKKAVCRAGTAAALRFLLLSSARAAVYTGSLDSTRGDLMTNDTKNDDGSPKFGRLLLALLAAVVFCGVLTWVMGTFFPNFPS
jgi:hypothetical protein